MKVDPHVDPQQNGKNLRAYARAVWPLPDDRLLGPGRLIRWQPHFGPATAKIRLRDISTSVVYPPPVSGK
jgi:hypothetical protein